MEATERAAPLEKFLTKAFELNYQRKPDEALKYVARALIIAPDDHQALMLALQIHSDAGRFCEAAEVAYKLAGVDPRNAIDVLLRAFDLNLRCGNFPAAEASLNDALERAPRDPRVRRLLVQLLNAQGRRHEATEHVIELMRLRAIGPQEMLSLIDVSGPFLIVSFDPFVKDSEPTLFSLGAARTMYVAKNTDPKAVLAMLQGVREKFPESTAAAAFHGRVLAETGRVDEFAKWLQKLPPGIDQQPEYWSSLGKWLAQTERHEPAIRSFGEALRLDPSDRESLRAMIRSLELVGEEKQAFELRQRLTVLDQIFRTAKTADAQQSAWISDRLLEFVRPWESVSWLLFAAEKAGQVRQQLPELHERHVEITAWEQSSTAERIRDVRLERMLGFKIERWPLPDLNVPTAPTKPTPIANLNTGLQFADVAGEAGIETTFQSGFPVDGGIFYAYQTNGGGLAALDYDLDGRCDLYLGQSGGKPNDPSGSTANQLFRLLPDQRYQEVTEPSLTGDKSFGQGVCAGDVNQDGFPDLLVANIGVNVVYLNQGDGTFRVAGDLISEQVENWTSSIGLGDLDGDQLPEIIEINYIDDPQAFVVECEDDHTACQPQRFQAAADRILKSAPDGTFRPWQGVPGIGDSPKLGFGLVIANFDRKHGNDFFVSNDGDLNHYWTSTPAADPPADPRAGKYALVEAAGVRGCSIGRAGNAQACMGIAAGDFNRDGTLDLHITNFHNEPVNLYMQTKSGFFSDEVLKYGLQEPSFAVLGFGTQTADFDNDGWLDIAVLNGHVFDAQHLGIPYKMKSQLFRGSPQGFAWQDQPSAGAYWQTAQLGRTLAMLDWNRDGRMDLISNHLDSPVALLQNNSPAANWLQLELVGVGSERDAIAAEVVVKTAGESWTAWQTGGDGVMCSNEAVVHIGLGTVTSIDSVQVSWPSGTTQTFADVQPNTRYLAVEGEAELFAR
jgi:tetratricopeptide (TPR) repeat protein